MNDPMRSIRKLAILIAAVAGMAIAGGGSALAEDGHAGQDNIVTAINTRDNATVVRTSLRIVFVSGTPVTAQNIAYAYDSCQNCQATAVALEGVVIEGQNSSITPLNAAVALNDKCSSCHALAYAGQANVQYLSGQVRFTERGEERIEAIREGLGSLHRRGLSQATIKARAEALYAELVNVLNSELVPDSGDDEHVDHSRQVEQAA